MDTSRRDPSPSPASTSKAKLRSRTREQTDPPALNSGGPSDVLGILPKRKKRRMAEMDLLSATHRDRSSSPDSDHSTRAPRPEGSPKDSAYTRNPLTVTFSRACAARAKCGKPFELYEFRAAAALFKLLAGQVFSVQNRNLGEGITLARHGDGFFRCPRGKHCFTLGELYQSDNADSVSAHVASELHRAMRRVRKDNLTIVDSESEDSDGGTRSKKRRRSRSPAPRNGKRRRSPTSAALDDNTDRDLGTPKTRPKQAREPRRRYPNTKTGSPPPLRVASDRTTRGTIKRGYMELGDYCSGARLVRVKRGRSHLTFGHRYRMV